MTSGDQVIGVMLWRVIVNTFYGRSLYVDDLITDKNKRSQLVGKAMFDWAIGRAATEKCVALRLDSGPHGTQLISSTEGALQEL